MLRSFIFALTALWVVCAAHAAADPSIRQIYQAASTGRLADAELMIQQVLRTHPNSGKAHYVHAELLVKAGRRAEAADELAAAERLSPGLAFASAASVAELRAHVQAPARAAPDLAAPAATAGLPWGLIVGGGLFLLALVFFLRRMNRQQVFSAYPAAAPGSAGWNAPPVMGGSGMMNAGGMMGGGGMGSSLLGGLATGAAVGAGVVAGEALMQRMIGGGSHNSDSPFQQERNFTPSSMPADDSSNYDLGGKDFGLTDGASSWDDSGSSSGGVDGGGDW